MIFESGYIEQCLEDAEIDKRLAATAAAHERHAAYLRSLVGGLRVLENSTRVDADLMPRIQSIGPIAHQQARFDHLTAETARRYPIARRERRKLDVPAVEEPIAGNEEGIGPVAHEGGERRLNF